MSNVAKGKILADYTYEYTCGNCGGIGWFANGDECTHCYNLEYDNLVTAFKTARGQRYYAILKAILSITGKSIASEFAERDKSSVAHVIEAMVKYKFPRNRMKPLMEWLEECRVIRAGSYLRFKESKWTVKEALNQLGYSDYDL